MAAVFAAKDGLKEDCLDQVSPFSSVAMSAYDTGRQRIEHGSLQ
jgi:hypothetical protein